MSAFKAKMHQFDFGWGSASDTLWELTVLPRPITVFTGPTSKGRGRERKREVDRKERRKGKRRREHRGDIPHFYLD